MEFGGILVLGRVTTNSKLGRNYLPYLGVPYMIDGTSAHLSCEGEVYVELMGCLHDQNQFGFSLPQPQSLKKKWSKIRIKQS